MFECQMNYTLTHKNKTFGAGCKDTSIFRQIWALQMGFFFGLSKILQIYCSL